MILPAGNPVVTGTTISSTWANTTLNDIANELTNSIPRDGSAPPTANIPFNTYRLTGLGNGLSGQDAVTYAQTLTALADPTSAANGPNLVAYGYDQAYAARTVGGRLRDLGVFASDIPGYDPTGAVASDSAIATAVAAAASRGLYTVFITGAPKITAAITYTNKLALVGVGAGNFFSNDPDTFPVKIKCGGVTGYIFDQPDVVDGSGALTLSRICFDGRTSGATRSTTLQGIVKAATTAGKSSFYLRMNNCMVGGSDSATAMLSLSGEVFALFDNCMFSNWPYGYGHQGGLASILATTITFNKCYWNSVRQVGEWITNVTDVTYNNCVIESCVVAVAAILTNVTFNNLYSENMGYDASGTAITTGLTARSLGIADAPAISGNVSAVFTNRYGQFTFNQPTFQNTTGGKKWFDGIGRGSGIGGGGVMTINDISFAAGVISTLFTADADVPSSKSTFEYNLTSKAGLLYIPAADARLISKGRAPILWTDGNARIVEIDNGIFTTPPLSTGGFTVIPAISPSGGSNAIGDIVKMAPSQFQQGSRSAYRCSVAGSPGKWDVCDFIPSSLQATLGIAGTMVVTANAVDNPGEEHVWEVMASAGANVESHYRVTMQSFTGAGQLSTQAIVVTKTLTFTMTWGSPYTITITNTSGVAGLVTYARLVSVTSTHT